MDLLIKGLFIGLLLITSCLKVQANNNYEKLYEQIFGYKPVQTYSEVNANLIINNTYTGEILIKTPLLGNNIIIEPITFFNYLKPHIIPSALKELKNSITQNVTLATDLLAKMDIKTKFIVKERNLFITIPASKKTLTVLDVSGNNDRQNLLFDKYTEKPAFFSGFTNFNIVLSSEQINKINISQLFNLKGPYSLILKGEIGNHNALNEYYFIYENPDKQIKGQIGTIYSTITDNTFYKYWGVSFENKLSYKPLIKIQPEKKHYFLLNKKQRINLLVNKKIKASYFLEPGRYELQNLPLEFGNNKIEVQYYDLGKKLPAKTEHFEFVKDWHLLKPGLQEFFVGLGILDSKLATAKYEDLNVFATQRIGLSDILTLNYGLRGAAKNKSLNLNLTSGTPIALAQLGLSVTATTNMNCSKSFFLKLNSYPSDQERLVRNWLGKIELNYDSEQSLLTSLYSDFEIFAQKILKFDLTNTYFPKSSKNNTLLVLTFNGYYNSEISYSFNLKWLNNWDYQDQAIIFNCNWHPQVIPMQLNIETDSIKKDTDLKLSYSKKISSKTDTKTELEYKTDYFSANIFANHKWDTRHKLQAIIRTELIPDQKQQELELYLNHPAGTLSFAYDSLALNNEYSKTQTFQIDTAFAFADGEYTITQPIENSFAIFTIAENLKKYDLFVGKNTTRDLFGKTIATSDFNLYQTNTISISAPNLPIGLDIGKSIYKFKPAYGCGYKIQLETTNSTVLLTGTIIDKDKKPLPLLVGKMISITDKSEPVKFLFSNHDGEIQVSGLKAGKYKLYFGNKYKETEIIIPENTNGIFDIGAIPLI